MKVLVTGGGGFLGSAIVHQLLKRGDQVRILNRHTYPDLAKEGVEIYCGDISDKAAVLNACKGMDAVIHTAAKVGVWGLYDDYYKANVTGTRHVIEGCLTHNVPYLVYTSTPSVVFRGRDIKGGNESLPYADEFLSYYPQTKVMAEKLVLDANGRELKTVALRPHLIWGPGDNQLIPRLLERARQGKLALIKGQYLIDTIYVDNAAKAHLLALDCLAKSGVCAGKAYFISQDEPVFLNEFVNDVLAAYHLPPVKHYVSPRFAYRLGYLIEKIYKVFKIEKEPPMTRFIAKQLSSSHWFDIKNAKEDLGYAPSISIKEGLKMLEKEGMRGQHERNKT